MAWPRILVTGETGFIGSWVVDALYSAGATDVVAGVRRPFAAPRSLPVKLAHCDLMDRESLKTRCRELKSSSIAHETRPRGNGRGNTTIAASDPRLGRQTTGSDEFDRRVRQRRRDHNRRCAGVADG
jgi:nucleoside-diphosphate-sugar epimerase